MPTTYSAGTIVSNVCVECTSGGNTTVSGATNTPHPYYTNGSGDVVIQTQMVTIGGPYGLNS